jgi:hypothetical protein
MTVKVRMFNKDGYEKEVLRFDDEQVRMHEIRVKDTFDGLKIDPKDFPEAEYFTIYIDWCK